jgi:hypothetical protein
MFRSKVRPINVPQYEHGRLSGTFAALWGNQDFDRPAIDSASFIQGVALHDWHYGPVDNLPIGEANEADWLEMVRKGVDYWFPDPTTDIVAKLHLRRLLSGRDSPEVQRLIRLVELRIVERLPQTASSREQFEWADKITRFCDDVAFDFSFETPVKETRSLCTKANSSTETPVTYSIGSDGEITVEPWPFGPPSFSGFIIGYERAGYPDRLQPTLVPYHCRPGS